MAVVRCSYPAGAQQILAIPGPYDGRHWGAFAGYGVCCAARFTPLLEIGRGFRENFPPLPAENPTAGRISGANQAPEKRLVWRLGVQFF